MVLQSLEKRIERLEMENQRLRRRRRIIPLILMGVLILTSTLLFAVPNSFSSGDVISAAAMNDNFSFLEARSWSLNGSDLFFTGGNVGIGTNSPSTALSVSGEISDSDGYVLSHATAGTRIESGSQSFTITSASDTSGTVNFSAPFTAVPQVFLTENDSSSSGRPQVICKARNITTVGFDWHCGDPNYNDAVIFFSINVTIAWLTIGN